MPFEKDSKKDLVSVIITAYNAARYLAEAIESTLEQTYSNIELILVNDGSKDNTLEIMQDYAQKDTRIKILSHPNMGISASNNFALKEAKGKYVAKLDADDSMLVNRIEKQVEFLKEHLEVGLVSCHAFYINNKSQRIKGIQKIPGFTQIEDSIKARDKGHLVTCLHSGLLTYKHALEEIKGYRTDLTCAVDVDLCTRLVEKGYNLIIMQEPLVNYRVHLESVMAITTKNNLTQNTRAWLADSLYRKKQGLEELSFELFLQNRAKQSWVSKIRQQAKDLNYFYRRRALIYYSQNQWHLAGYSILIATLLNPVIVLKRLISLLAKRIQ